MSADVSGTLHIARMDRIPHEPEGEGRRVLAVGRTKGGSPLLQVTARSGDLYASARMQAARRERSGKGERP